MKTSMCIILTLGLLFEITANPLSDTLASLARYCIKEPHSEVDGLYLINDWKPIPEDDLKAQKLLGCIYNRLEVVSADNIVSRVKFFDFLLHLIRVTGTLTDGTLEMAKELVNDCADVQADSYQLRALRIHNCMVGFIM